MKDPTRRSSGSGHSDMDLANGYNSPPSGGGNNNNTNSVNLHNGASVQNGGTSNGQMPNGYQKMHLQKLEGTNFLGFLSPTNDQEVFTTTRTRSASTDAPIVLSATKQYGRRITLTKNLNEKEDLEMRRKNPSRAPTPDLGATNFLGFLSPVYNQSAPHARPRSASTGSVLTLSANRRTITLTNNLVERRALEQRRRTNSSASSVSANGNATSIDLPSNKKLAANRTSTLSNSVTELRNINKRKRQSNSLSASDVDDNFMAKFTNEDTYTDHQKPRSRNQVLSKASSFQSVFLADSNECDTEFAPGFKKSQPSNPRKPNLVSASTPNTRLRHQSADQSKFLNGTSLVEANPPDYMMVSPMKSASESGGSVTSLARAKRCTLTNSSTELRKQEEKYDTNLWHDTEQTEVFMKPGKIQTRPKNGLDIFLTKQPRMNPNPLLEAYTPPGFTSPSDSQLSPNRTSKNELNYSRKRVVPNYDRDKTYFPFGKPGSGAPLKDESGKLKTSLNGKFIADYYRLDSRDQKQSEKRKQMLDEQKCDVTLAERKRREMALQLRGNGGSSLDFAEKIRSFSDLYPTTNTTRCSSDVTRQRLDIRPVDPLESRLYSDELARQASQQKDSQARQRLEEYQQDAKHESTMNGTFMKRQGNGAPSTYRPTGNRRIRLEDSLYPNKITSDTSYQRLFPVPMKKSNSETDVTKSMVSPRQNNLFWWLNSPQPVEYKLQAPFATSNETY